jgi:hypothetical protein
LIGRRVARWPWLIAIVDVTRWGEIEVGGTALAKPSLRRAVSDALVAQGYEREDQLLRRPIDAEFTWVVDTGPLDRGPDISPYIGLRHERAHKVFSECIELVDSGFVATGGSNLGYVLGHGFRTWHEPATPEALVAEIEKGQEVLSQFLSLARMPEIYDIRGAKGSGYHFKLAAIYFVLHDCAMSANGWPRVSELTVVSRTASVSSSAAFRATSKRAWLLLRRQEPSS